MSCSDMLITWQWEPRQDMQVPHLGRAIRWQECDGTATGVVWVPAQLCDPTDPFDTQITKAVLLELCTSGRPISVSVRHHAADHVAWRITPVSMLHTKGVDAAVLLHLATEDSPAGQILINQDINDSSRLRTTLRWSMNVVGEFDALTAQFNGWTQRYSKWCRVLFAHPCTSTRAG